MLAKARAAKPSIKYAANEAGDIIAAWDEALGRWVRVAILHCGEWQPLSVELLIDGKPCPFEPAN